MTPYEHDPDAEHGASPRWNDFFTQTSQGYLAKGAELGSVQFGGSTYCLVFRPGVIADFAATAIPQPHDPTAPFVPMCSRLATAT